MKPIQVNCPDCQKLFLVKEEDLSPGEVHFECSSCDTPFAINWPQPPGVFELRGYHWNDREKAEPSVPRKPLPPQFEVATRICFKCSTHVDLRLNECTSCGVVFDKEVRPSILTGSLKGSTVREVRLQWDMVKLNYNDMAKHDEFIRYCLEREALVFASQCYKKILTANATDLIAKKMQEKLVTMATLTYLNNRRRIEIENASPIRKIEALILSFGIIGVVAGIMIPVARPLLAIGAAVLVFILMVRFLNPTPTR